MQRIQSKASTPRFHASRSERAMVLQSGTVLKKSKRHVHRKKEKDLKIL